MILPGNHSTDDPTTPGATVQRLIAHRLRRLLPLFASLSVLTSFIITLSNCGGEDLVFPGSGVITATGTVTVTGSASPIESLTPTDTPTPEEI